MSYIKRYIEDNDLYPIEEELEECMQREKQWKQAYMKAMKQWGKSIKVNIGLQKRINKAIDYIENSNICVEYSGLRTGKWELLEILKGEENE